MFVDLCGFRIKPWSNGSVTMTKSAYFCRLAAVAGAFTGAWFEAAPRPNAPARPCPRPCPRPCARPKPCWPKPCWPKPPAPYCPPPKPPACPVGTCKLYACLACNMQGARSVNNVLDYSTFPRSPSSSSLTCPWFGDEPAAAKPNPSSPPSSPPS